MEDLRFTFLWKMYLSKPCGYLGLSAHPIVHTRLAFLSRKRFTHTFMTKAILFLLLLFYHAMLMFPHKVNEHSVCPEPIKHWPIAFLWVLLSFNNRARISANRETESFSVKHIQEHARCRRPARTSLKDLTRVTCDVCGERTQPRIWAWNSTGLETFQQILEVWTHFEAD